MGVKQTILLVESDAQWQVLIKTLLMSEFDVDLATSAQAAIDMLDGNTYDAMVVNLQLPQNSGIELLNERASYADIASLPCVVYGADDQMLEITDEVWRLYRVDVYVQQTDLSQDLLSTLQRILVK